MVKKKEEPQPNLWDGYQHLLPLLKKIKRIAEIARIAATTQIQVPVQRVVANDKGENEIKTEMSPPTPIGQYDEIFRILMMRSFTSSDLERGGTCD